MNPSESEFEDIEQLEQLAADWMMKLDRGLTPEEQDEYTEWLAADPTHREAMALYQWGWDEFDRLAGLQTTMHAQVNPDLLEPEEAIPDSGPNTKKLISWMVALPLAAVLAFAVYVSWPDASPGGLEVNPAIELMARIEQRELEDGSTIEINRGAEVEVAYTAELRRVFLHQGEANFEVAKDPNRPFIVNVAGVDVRAVGTIFSVKLSENEVDVIVTEGKVNVAPDTGELNLAPPTSGSFLEIGQRAKVDLSEAEPIVEVMDISQSEVEKANRWQPRLLDFDGAPLPDIVAEFNRSNPIQVVIGDASLESVRLSNLFWSDNVEGFVRLMESSFDMEAEWRGSREIVLRNAASNAQ